MIGILGGTFDPVHFGHLRPALELLQQLPLTEIRLIPCRIPPHRGRPVASPEDRLRMVAAAVADEPQLIVDDRELHRDGPSYSVDTLLGLRAELGDTESLALIMGMDAFHNLSSWHRWQEIPNLAHLLVTYRPGAPVPRDGALGRWARAAQAGHVDTLCDRPAGGLLIWSVTQLDISATAIRDTVARGESVRYLLPDPVWAYIQTHRLYRDLSRSNNTNQ